MYSEKNKKEDKLELCYLWIGNNCLSNMKNQGFNFSTDLEFEFIENKLTIRYKNKFINNFYGKNIINVSAIVGENGSGKTSIINFFKNCKFESSELKEIVIFKKFNEIHIFNTINLCKNTMCNNTNYNFIIHDLLKNKVQNEFDKLGKKSIIFYSDIFNCRKENLSENNSGIRKRYNISTDHLIISDKRNKLANRMNVDQVKRFKILDTFRDLNFIIHSNTLKENKIINPPIKYMRICIEDKNDWIYINKSESNNLNKCATECLIIKLAQLLNKVNKNDEYFKISIIFYIFYELFEVIKNNKKVTDQLNKCLSDYENSCEIDNKIENINLNNYFNVIKNICKNIDITRVVKEYLVFGEFINILDIFKDKWIKQNNFRKLILELESNKENIKQFLNQYLNFSFWGLFKIEWCQEPSEEFRILSSGEQTMLRVYSRFYSIIDYIDVHDGQLDNRLDEEDKNLLILLDEPELYLHPEWQRKLLTRLVKFYEVIFKDRNIQIILTSNTPFVISDIPKDNIIFMKKNKKNQLCEVISKDNIGVQTFGANIHTLLTNSFFMDNTIGEFANRKIKKVIQDLNEKSREEILRKNGRKEEIEYIIDNIGEPVIKRKLENMYDKKFEHFEMNNRIKELSSKVKELEKIIKGNGLV